MRPTRIILMESAIGACASCHIWYCGHWARDCWHFRFSNVTEDSEVKPQKEENGESKWNASGMKQPATVGNLLFTKLKTKIKWEIVFDKQVADGCY